jgi:putative ABC transport system permease protein
VNVALPDRRYATEESRIAFFDALLDRVRNIPGVLTTGAVHGLPLDGNQSNIAVLPEGMTLAPGERPPTTRWTSITPGYFEALRIPLLEGRPFTSADIAGGDPVVVVSRSFANRFWNGEGAVGRRFRMGDVSGSTAPVTVAGVVDDVLHFGLDATAEPIVYRPFPQAMRGWLGVLVRYSGDADAAMLQTLRATIWSLDPALPLDTYGTMTGSVRSSIGPTRFRAAVLSAFSMIAALLSFVGLHATLAWTVRTRRREMVIRMALGAAAHDVRRMVVARGMMLATAGIALGLAGAIAATRLLASMLFGVTTTDLPTFALVAAGMLVVAFIACWFPARRAAATDPARTLRID